MYTDSQTSFIGQLNDKFFIAKCSYILESGFFLTFSAFSPLPFLFTPEPEPKPLMTLMKLMNADENSCKLTLWKSLLSLNWRLNSVISLPKVDVQPNR